MAASPQHNSTRLAGLKIALVFPIFTNIELASYQDNARFLGSIPPLSLAYVATTLKSHGAEVLLLDCPTLGLTLPQAIERLRAFAPTYVGFTLTTVDWASSLFWIRGVKAALSTQVLVGGVHMECYPKETLTHKEIDLGFIGYADLGLVDLLEAHQGEVSLDQTPGAVFRKEDGEVQANAHAPFNRDATPMGVPERASLPFDRHFSIVSTERNFTAAMSNFGCPFGCEFCILANNSVRWREAHAVVDEMEYCFQELGVREMDFFDPIFTIRKDRVLAICDEIIRRGLHKKMIWSVRARTDSIDDTCLDAMWDAGCRRIFFGLESGSDVILQRVDKRQKSPEHIRRVIRAAKRRGFEILAFVMVGNPLETQATVAMTRNLLLELPIDLVQVASLFPLPKTPIYNAIVEETGRDFWQDHILTGSPVKPFPLLETSLTLMEVEDMVTRLYADFYFRPQTLRVAARRLKHPAAVKRGLRAAGAIATSAARSALRSMGG